MFSANSSTCITTDRRELSKSRQWKVYFVLGKAALTQSLFVPIPPLYVRQVQLITVCAGAVFLKQGNTELSRQLFVSLHAHPSAMPNGHAKVTAQRQKRKSPAQWPGFFVILFIKNAQE